MTFRTLGMGRFEFVKLSVLRTAQLMRGSTPRVTKSLKFTTTAQREVAAGKIARDSPETLTAP